MTRHHARSSAEAHLYMDQRPCACGSCEFERHAAVISDGDALCSRYAGPCLQCGTLREFVFELPEALRPVTAALEYGGSEPSRLLDPGEWLAIADAHAQRSPGAPRDRAIARAAIAEVLKFVPAGAERVPVDAFHSARGRAVRDAEPERFHRDRLEAMLAADREPAPDAASAPAADDGPADAPDDADDADDAQRSVTALIDELARAVVRGEGFAGDDLRRHAGDLAGQLHTLIRIYQVQAREELTRRASTVEIEQLLDTLARTPTPVGAAIAAHRAAILDAFRQVGIAEIGRGVELLARWIRDPTAEHRASVEQLLADLKATLGAGELAEAEASQRRIDHAVRASLGLFGQPRPPVPPRLPARPAAPASRRRTDTRRGRRR